MEDLFTVVHDQVLTDTARFADVVLPATTHFETHDLAESYGSFVLQEMRPVIERVGRAGPTTRSPPSSRAVLDYDLTRFSIGREEILDRCLKDDGAYDGARATRPPGGTVQFRDTFPSHAEHRAQLAAIPGLGVPRYVELDDPFPLTLLTPASPKTINSMFAEFQPPDPAVRMHPDDAATRGLVDGQAVRVHNEPCVALDRAHMRRRVASRCGDPAEGFVVSRLRRRADRQRARSRHAVGPRGRCVLQRHARRGEPDLTRRVPSGPEGRTG